MAGRGVTLGKNSVFPLVETVHLDIVGGVVDRREIEGDLIPGSYPEAGQAEFLQGPVVCGIGGNLLRQLGAQSGQVGARQIPGLLFGNQMPAVPVVYPRGQHWVGADQALINAQAILIENQA